MTRQRIGITGVTGHIGGAVARDLQDLSERLRLFVRDAARVPKLAGEVAVASYDSQAAEALRGVDLLFMVSAAESPERLAQHKAFIDAAASAGVQHVVYTSFLGAAPDATFTLARDHFATEEHIKASGMAWTFLRDSFYLDFLPDTVSEDGVIRGPAGTGRVGAVARADVAATAAAILRDAGAHERLTWDLTGPQTLSFPEIAKILSQLQGRQVSYVDETLDEARASRAHYGAPDWELEAWITTYTAIAAGELDVVTDHVQQVTGNPPRSLREVVQDS